MYKYQKGEKEKTKQIPTVSRRLSDGRMVELLFDEEKVATSLAVYADGHVNIVDRLDTIEGELAPLRANHGLLKHRVVLLPSKAEEYGDKAALLAEITAYIAKYVSMSETFLSIASHYVLLTWLYDAFAEVPYLRWRGDFGSGKSRALWVIGSITYKPIFASGASTVSPIFHTLDLFKGTLVFDEADFRFSDERAELTKIFNNGTTRGFPVLRASMSEGKDFDPRAFDVFGPKLVGMREVFQDYALESRFLTEVMTGTAGDEVPISLPASQKDEALQLRNKLLMFRFRDWNRTAIDDRAFCPELSPRSNQILLPLLSVTESDQTRNMMQEFVLLGEAELARDRSTQIEAIVLESIFEIAKRDSEITHIPLALIRSTVLARTPDEIERPLTSRYLGSLIRNKLRLSSYKSGVYMVRIPDAHQSFALAKKYGLSLD